MLEIDDSQEFVWEIIDEVFDSTIKIIYDRYLEKQAIPYTISKAHEAILHIIDVFILKKLWLCFKSLITLNVYIFSVAISN